MLRDEGSAAERLAHVLARGRFVAELLERAPDTVQVLGHDTGLDPRTAEALRTEMVSVGGPARRPGQGRRRCPRRCAGAS